MSTWAKLRAGPVARLSLGLMALVISLLMLADMLLGVAPDRGDLERQLRQRSSESLAVQITALLESGDDGTLSKTIQQVIGRNADILSIAVRRAEGSIVAQGGDHGKPTSVLFSARVIQTLSLRTSVETLKWA